jgi:membrane-associated phospholipid phosphatase
MTLSLARTGARSPSRSVRSTRLLLAGVALALVAVPFTLVLVLVEDKWEPLAEADHAARDGLHAYAMGHPAFVTLMKVISDSGSALAWQIILGLVAIWLLWRRLWRLALFVVVTGACSSLLNTLVKTAVHRPRPLVAHPLVHEPGASFPSGHAQAAVTGYAVILLVFLPVLSAAWRRIAVAVAVFMVLAIGFSRVAVAAHFVSDVLAAYILGAAWVVAMTALFSAWRLHRGRPAVTPSEGLEPEQTRRLDPTARAAQRDVSQPE